MPCSALAAAQAGEAIPPPLRDYTLPETCSLLSEHSLSWVPTPAGTGEDECHDVFAEAVRQIGHQAGQRGHAALPSSSLRQWAVPPNWPQVFDFMLLCFTPGTGPKPPLSSDP
jgi:hypothetical protein